jgi:hypothetical protein
MVYLCTYLTVKNRGEREREREREPSLGGWLARESDTRQKSRYHGKQVLACRVPTNAVSFHCMTPGWFVEWAMRGRLTIMLMCDRNL